MKKIIITTFVFLLTTSILYSQRGRVKRVKWLDIELKGGYGASILLNSDVSGDQNADLALTKPAYEFGARLGLTYGDRLGVGVEWSKSSFKQEYNIKAQATQQAYIKTQQFASTNITVSLRYTSLYGFYFELGPQFSNITKAKVENSVQHASFTDISNDDYQKHFAEKFNSIMFGLGYAAYNGDRLRVNLGLRALYGISNFVDDSDFYVLNDGYYVPKGNFNSDTKPLSVKFTVAVNYIFGFWGNATCGRGRLVFFQ